MLSGEEQEVLSPLKVAKAPLSVGGSKKALTFEPSATELENMNLETSVLHSDQNSVKQGAVGDIERNVDQKAEGGSKGRGFKRIIWPKENKEKGEGGEIAEKKSHQGEEEDMVVDGLDRALKLGKLMEESSVVDVMKAGPANWSCGDQ